GTGQAKDEGATADSGKAKGDGDKTDKAAEPAAATAQQTSAATGEKTGAASEPTYVRSPEPIDLLESAGAPVLKRLAPVVGGPVLVLLLWRWRRRRARRRSNG